MSDLDARALKAQLETVRKERDAALARLDVVRDERDQIRRRCAPLEAVAAAARPLNNRMLMWWALDPNTTEGEERIALSVALGNLDEAPAHAGDGDAD